MTASSIYKDLAVLGVALLAAGSLAVLFRILAGRALQAKGRGWSVLVSRLLGPGIFLGVTALVRAVFTVSSKLSLYLDAAFLFFVIVLAVRLVDGAVAAVYAGRRRPYPLPNVLRGMIFAAVYLAIFFIILKSMLGLNIGTFLAGSAILTAVIGLALQGVLGNILTGLSLHFARAFSRGDWVGVGGVEGVVMDMNWRETRLLDRQSNIVVIPNNVVAAEKVVNFSRPDKRSALLLNFKVSAQAPAARVLEAVREAAVDCPRVLREPSPLAYVRSFDETGVTYAVKHWVDDFALKDVILTEVGKFAWYKLRRRGIEVAVSWPDRVRELGEAIEKRGREAGGKREGADAAAEVDRTAAYLRASSFLKFNDGPRAAVPMLADEEVRLLAAASRRSDYTAGKYLCRQGEKGRSCFLVVRGRIHGEIAYEEDGKRYLTEFDVGPGGLFGEMSLFTGLPRTATGRVAEESELVEIQAEDFGRLLARNPGITEAVADMIAARNAQNREFLLKIKELSANEVEDSADRHSVLAYLKKFVSGLWK